MKRIVLSKAVNQGDALRRDLDELQISGPKLYRINTYIHSDFKKVATIITTSKDVFLRLGQLSREGLMELAQLIWRNNARGEGMIILENEREGARAYLAILSENGGEGFVINLSPAH